MTVEDEKLLRYMISAQAYIILDDFGDIYPIHAGGNKRGRAKRWIEKATFTRMLRNGWLEYEGAGVRVSDSLQMRLLHPIPETAHAAQHRTMREGTVYIQEGVKRPVKRNDNITTLRRLSRRRDGNGRLRFTAAEVEAGELFARDYALSGVGAISSQNYDGVRVDGGSKQGGAEDAIIKSMDRRNRVAEAISCMGPGLDRALIAVCCENGSIEHLERAENWAKNSGMTVLKLALGRLAQFYGTHPGEHVSRNTLREKPRAWKEIKPIRSAS